MDRKPCIRSSQQFSVGQEATYSLHNNGLLDRGFITAWRIVLGSLVRDCCLLFQFNRQFPPVIVSLRRLLSPGMLALLNRNSELTLIRRLIWQFTSRLVIRQWTVRRQLVVTRAVTSSLSTSLTTRVFSVCTNPCLYKLVIASLCKNVDEPFQQHMVTLFVWCCPAIAAYFCDEISTQDS